MFRIHNHAFWIYGVIVALAIRESLTKITPHIFPSLGVLSSSPVPEPYGQMSLEVFRFVIFFGTIIRIYLGSAFYFDKVYFAEGADAAFKKKNYGMDFLLGLIHFVIFFVWSQTVIIHERLSHGLSDFLLLVGIILLYDVAWWFLSARLDTVRIIRVWALLNTATVILAILVWAITNDWVGLDAIRAETATLIPVLIMIIVDFGEMLSGKNVVTEYLSNSFQKADT